MIATQQRINRFLGLADFGRPLRFALIAAAIVASAAAPVAATAQQLPPAVATTPDLDARYLETRKQVVALVRGLQERLKSDPESVPQAIRHRSMAFVAELKSIEADPEALAIVKRASPEYVLALARWSLGSKHPVSTAGAGRQAT